MPVSTNHPQNLARDFLLNAEAASSGTAPGRLLLDHLRRDQRLKGTKEGCREGDCGACAVLLGELMDGEYVAYRAVPSCMLLAPQVIGRHVVTIEGLNLPRGLTPQQSAIVDAGASQCGFCTPGFVVSFTNLLLSAAELSLDEAITAIGGNLCRCTGYVSLVRAAEELVSQFENLSPPGPLRTKELVELGVLPKHFLEAAQQLRLLRKEQKLLDTSEQRQGTAEQEALIVVAGATDLIVQHGAAINTAPLRFQPAGPKPSSPYIEGDELIIPGATSFESLRRSPAFATVWPSALKDLELFASALIRERATVAGNIANASPIADGTAMLLALEARLEIGSREGLESAQSNTRRQRPLADFFQSYKQIDLGPDEWIHNVRIALQPRRRVHFEKISKRTYLDIATVNSAVCITTSKDGIIESIMISAGGVAPTPLVLIKTAAFLTGKTLGVKLLLAAMPVLDDELAPIDDVRGSAAYKRLAIRQLFFAHFLDLFPSASGLIDEAALLEAIR